MSTTRPSSSTVGFWTAVALVMGNMIGSGIFLLPASLAPFGGLSIAGWLVSASGAMALAVVFARLARLDPAAGGPYAYTRRAFGDLPAFLVAWGYWISTWTALGALAVALVAYLTLFVPGLAASPVAAAGVAIGAVWVAVAINAAGVRAAGSVQVVTTVLKVLPLAAVGLFGLTYVDASHFAVASTDARSLLADVPAVATLTLFAYLGLESATIPAGNISDPAQTIPRATLIGTALTAVVYIVTTVGVMSVLAPAQLSTSAAPFADAATTMAGGWAGRVVAAGAVISCFGALNGWMLVVGQLPLAVARDGLFPGVFARLSGRGTPTAGFVIAGLLTTVLVGLNYTRGLVDIFTFLILLSTLANLIPYAFCSLAIFLLRDDAAGGPLPAGVAVTAGLAFVYALWAMGGAGYEAVYWGFLLLIGGLPVYVAVARRRRRRGTPAAEPVAIGSTSP